MQPRQFAEEWIAAWNARDLESVMAFYAEEVVFTSPTAARVVPQTGGVVRGKDALRDYWTRALAQNPDLAFTLVGVYAGINTVVVHYRNQFAAPICEVAVFNDGLITAGHATHLESIE